MGRHTLVIIYLLLNKPEIDAIIGSLRGTNNLLSLDHVRVCAHLRGVWWWVALNGQAAESQARAQKIAVEAQAIPQELEIDRIKAVTTNLTKGDADVT